MADTWIYIEHPDIDAPPVVVALESFLKSFEKKGWVAVEVPPKSSSAEARETFKRVFGNVPKKDAVKGPKKKK